MILNLTQHAATEDQIAQGVINLPEHERAALLDLLTFDEVPSEQEMLNRAHDVALLAVMNGLGGEGDDPLIQSAMIGGAPFFMRHLEDALAALGISPVYAFSKRVSVEVVEPCGTVKKVNQFRHAGFVDGKKPFVPVRRAVETGASL